MRFKLKIIHWCLLIGIIFYQQNFDRVFAQDSKDSDATVKLGALLLLTGEYAMQGQAFLEGIQLAEDEINQGGGVNGRRLKVIVEDTQYNMRQVHTISKKLTEVDKVKGAVISTITETMVAGPEFERRKIPLINMWDSSPQIEELGKYVFGIGTWTPSTGEKSAEFALRNLRAKTAATIAVNGSWTLVIAKDFRSSFKAGGGKFLKEFAVNPSDRDFKTIITKVKRLNPDVLYAPVDANIATFFQQLKKLGFNKPVITSDVLSEELVNTIGHAANGIYQTLTADPNYPSTKKMLKLYQDKFGKKCTQLIFTAWGYDAIHLLAKALKVGRDNNEKINEALYQIKNYPGASGVLTIDENGSSKKRVSMFQVKGQKFVLVN